MKPALNLLRGVLIIAAFVAVLIRPGYGEQKVKTEVADVEVMVVVDRTWSMAATDWNGSSPRIDGVRDDVRALIGDLPGTRFSLVTWGTGARLELPFTSDTTAVTGAVDSLRLEDPYGGEGTKVDTPLDVMTEELQRAEKQYPDRRRMLVFMSDGEATAGGTQESFASLAEYVDGGLVLGYGTEQGAPMPAASDLSDQDGNIQVDGKDAISKADPANLKAIADDTKTTYVSRTEPGGMAGYTKGFTGEFVAQGDETPGPKHDLTWVAGLVLFVLLLWVLHDAWQTAWTAPGALGEDRRRRRATRTVGVKS